MRGHGVGYFHGFGRWIWRKLDVEICVEMTDWGGVATIRAHLVVPGDASCPTSWCLILSSRARTRDAKSSTLYQ